MHNRQTPPMLAKIEVADSASVAQFRARFRERALKQVATESSPAMQAVTLNRQQEEREAIAAAETLTESLLNLMQNSPTGSPKFRHVNQALMTAHHDARILLGRLRSLFPLTREAKTPEQAIIARRFNP